jgi:2,3-bisphosphoglycerate-independent phosphoglycerate mutase
MQGFETVLNIVESTPSKIVLLVIDGLGGLPDPVTGKTELETACTPNLDRLAAAGNCGFTQPVGPGITPGSAPGHLSLFGYDPIKYAIGRGVLEALGIDLDLEPGDIAARGNFCSTDSRGLITDRRAGRISSEKSAQLCRLLDGQVIEGASVIVRPVKEHRFVLVVRGLSLDYRVTDTDPQHLGVSPNPARPLAPEASRTAGIINKFIERAKIILTEHHPANMLLLRGFSAQPDFPAFNNVYKLMPAAIASYPMYRGLAKVVGMTILPTGPRLNDEITTMAKFFNEFNFFFLHVKGADAAGEDGDFIRKVKVIEEVDNIIPEILNLEPDVLLVAGDHSTPAVMKAHSWHNVPCIVFSALNRPDRLNKFGETTCRMGSLGVIPATSLMPLALAHAQKLTKYGA